MARQLFQSRSDLQLQTEQLKQEIAERLKAEKELRTLSLGAIESRFLPWKPKISIRRALAAGDAHRHGSREKNESI